jgi:hypothetical protein
MRKVNVEVEAYTFDELRGDADTHMETMKEMRRIFGKDTLEELAGICIDVAEGSIKSQLNVGADISINVREGGEFDVDLRITNIASQKLPRDTRFNTCGSVREAFYIVEDIQLYGRTLRNLEEKGERETLQGELLDLIDDSTRELHYELIHSVNKTFQKDVDQLHTALWAETMAVQGGLLFTKAGKVIEDAINYNQSVIGE